MDETRKFRFLVPPFFFGLSLVLGFHLSGTPLTARLDDVSNERLAFVIAVAGASVLPLGFLLSSVSILLLRLISLFSESGTYEAGLKDSSYQVIYPLLGVRTWTAKTHLYASATFDHEILKPPVHMWIQRRWTTFNLGTHSLVAVWLSHVAAWFLGTPSQSYRWGLMTGVLSLVFGGVAVLAWRQTVGMLDFQADRQRPTDVSSPGQPKDTRSPSDESIGQSATDTTPATPD